MDSTQASRKIGRVAAQALFFCGVAYAIVTVIGVISLKSPQEPIHDPFFSLMEILIIITAPLLVVLMVAVHAYAARDDKVYSLTALAFMIVSAGITSSIHFVVLVASRQVAFRSLSWLPLFLSFQWPSVVYCQRLRTRAPKSI
jgi:cytochrome bd-type quinol oxidase subunit 2